MYSVFILTITVFTCVNGQNPSTTDPKRTTQGLPSTTPRPITCGENERVTKCRPCEQQCDLAVRNMTTVCMGRPCFNDGPQFCECPMDQGFARDYDKRCIKASSCPKPGCPSGEVWSDKPCDGTCDVPKPNCLLFDCVHPGCTCKPGFVRFYDHCIPLGMCPPKRKSPCGECPAGKICKRKRGWFCWFFSMGKSYECDWYDPCGPF